MNQHHHYYVGREPDMMIPTHVITAAETVANYFAERNISDWKLGGCQNRDENMPAAPAPVRSSSMAAWLRNAQRSYFGTGYYIPEAIKVKLLAGLDELDKALDFAVNHSAVQIGEHESLLDYITRLVRVNIDTIRFDNLPGIDHGPPVRKTYGPNGEEGLIAGDCMLPDGWTLHKPLAKTYPNFHAFQTAVAAYEGPEGVLLDGTRIMNLHGNSWTSILRYMSRRSAADYIITREAYEPLPKMFLNFDAFTIAVNTYEGPERIVLDGCIVRWNTGAATELRYKSADGVAYGSITREE